MTQSLQLMVKRYLEGGHARTPQSIAAASQNRVSASTVRRIAQGESSRVELHSVLAILQVVATLDESVAFLKTHFPSTGNYFESVLNATGASEMADGATMQSLMDFESFVIIATACTPTGTTKQNVTRRLGDAAGLTLDRLVDLGILSIRDGVYKTAQDSIFPCDNVSIKAQLVHCLQLVRDEHMGKKRQHCNVVTGGVSLIGQEKIHALLQKTKLELDALIEAHKGDQPIFCSVLQGTFLAEADHA